MSTALYACGWALAGALGGLVLLLRRRLELVARAEHELRGPLTVLSLAAERPARSLEAAALDAELARLRAGLADLTAARRGKAGAARSPESLDLEGFVRRAAAGWRPALLRAGRDVRVRWSGRGTVRAGRGDVAKALGNVLANAVEHGDGPLEIRGGRWNGRVRVEVENRGRGLAIAAAAARDAGGRLEVRSRGESTVAALELPADDAQDPERPPAAA